MRARTARPNSGSTASTRGARRRIYSARERAALEWTEALTLVSETRVPDEVYERVREQFSEDELVHLSLAVVAINGWNRLNIAARTVPGGYVAGGLAKVHAAGDRECYAGRYGDAHSVRSGFEPRVIEGDTRGSNPATAYLPLLPLC